MKECLILLYLHVIKRVSRVTASLIALILLSDICRHEGVFKQCEKWSVVSIWGCCSPFPLVFGQVLGADHLLFCKDFDSLLDG